MKTQQTVWRCDWVTPILEDEAGGAYKTNACTETIVVDEGIEGPASFWMLAKHRQRPDDTYCPLHAQMIRTNGLKP